MFERYCDIKYRDCVLQIDEHNHNEPTRNHFFTAKSSSMGIYEGRSLVGRYPEVKTVISEFFRLIDRLLGERELVISESDDFLYCSVVYKGYELKIYHKTKESHYCAWIDGFDFASWGEWSVEQFVSVINAFREKVDSGTGEDLIHTFVNYKGRNLIVKKTGVLYIGTSYVHGENWRQQSFDLDFLVRWFKSYVDEFPGQEKLEQYEYF